jgi:hypothetical protein
MPRSFANRATSVSVEAKPRSNVQLLLLDSWLSHFGSGGSFRAGRSSSAVIGVISSQHPQGCFEHFVGMNWLCENLKPVPSCRRIFEQFCSRCLTREEQNSAVWELFLKKYCEIDAIHLRKNDIDNDQVRHPPCNDFGCLFRTISGMRLIAICRKDLNERIRNGVLVIDNQQFVMWRAH